jgi:hypothetical protein
VQIVDAHAYVGDSLFGNQRSPEDLLCEMDRLGIERAVLCPNKPPTYNLEVNNRLVASAVRKHRDRFWGWIRVDPWQGPKALDELRFGYEVLGLNGLMLHPYEEVFQISDNLVDPLMDYADEHKLPVLIESGYYLLSHPLDVAELAHRFSTVTIIGTHGLQLDDAGFALTDSDLAMRECPNIVMESSGMYAPDNMKMVVENLGSNRLLFGSHSPWLCLEFELERCKRLSVTDAQKKVILSENIINLIRTG